MTNICEKQFKKRNEMSEKINEPDKIICQMNEYYFRNNHNKIEYTSTKKAKK